MNSSWQTIWQQEQESFDLRRSLRRARRSRYLALAAGWGIVLALWGTALTTLLASRPLLLPVALFGAGAWVAWWMWRFSLEQRAAAGDLDVSAELERSIAQLEAELTAPARFLVLTSVLTLVLLAYPWFLVIDLGGSAVLAVLLNLGAVAVLLSLLQERKRNRAMLTACRSLAQSLQEEQE
ncbi:MAG: hypothetical protein RBU37_02675 [Myxococcota bacterium]|jgi:hypothetical protein|nr:hypothetical protein [Myxococcota bacterium]